MSLCLLEKDRLRDPVRLLNRHRMHTARDPVPQRTRPTPQSPVIPERPRPSRKHPATGTRTPGGPPHPDHDTPTRAGSESTSEAAESGAVCPSPGLTGSGRGTAALITLAVRESAVRHLASWQPPSRVVTGMGLNLRVPRASSLRRSRTEQNSPGAAPQWEHVTFRSASISSLVAICTNPSAQIPFSPVLADLVNRVIHTCW